MSKVPTIKLKQVYFIDDTDEWYPRLVTAIIEESAREDFFETFSEAKAALVEILRDRAEHWNMMLRSAKKLKKEEVEDV